MLMSFADSSGNPKRETKRGQAKLTLRDKNARSTKENQATSPRSGTSVRQQPPLASSPSVGDTLQFINLLGTEKHDTEGRNTVRSHARRHAWRNQRHQQDRKDVLALDASKTSKSRRHRDKSGRSLSASDNDSQTYYDQCSKFREIARQLPQRSPSYPPSKTAFANLPPELATCTANVLAMISQPQINRTSLTNGHSDPFDVFPISLTPRLHHFIHYSRGTQNLIHEDPQDTLSCHMGRSQALVYATLAWTTALASSNGGKTSPEGELYLQRSIVSINEDLSRLPQDGLSDGTIAAVACLTNMENLNGDKDRARIHMNGLQQMIKMRGGMSALGMNGILRRLVLWADVFCATRWQSTPQFPLVDLPDLLDLAPLCYFRPPSTPKPYFAIKNDTFVNLVNSTGNQILLIIMRDVYELSHFLDNTPPKDPGLLERASFSDRIYVIEHKLLWLIAQNQGRQPRDSILLSLMHSLLLYIYTNVRLTPVNGQIRLSLIARLQTYLQQADLEAINIHFPHELRWILFIGGGAASAGTRERAYFVRTLVDCGCRREWGNWENIILGLKGFETVFLARCEEYWKQVDEMRGTDGHKDGKHGPQCVGEENYFIKEYVDD